MRRLVNGVECNLEATGDDIEVSEGFDRLWVRSAAGSNSAVVVTDGPAKLVSFRGRQFRIERAGARGPADAMRSGVLVSPMPGLVVDVFVEEGARVSAGDRVLVIEAMKVHQVHTAPFEGIVTSLPVCRGSQVDEGTVLAKIEPETAESEA